MYHRHVSKLLASATPMIGSAMPPTLYFKQVYISRMPSTIRSSTYSLRAKKQGDLLYPSIPHSDQIHLDEDARNSKRSIESLAPVIKP